MRHGLPLLLTLIVQTCTQCRLLLNFHFSRFKSLATGPVLLWDDAQKADAIVAQRPARNEGSSLCPGGFTVTEHQQNPLRFDFFTNLIVFFSLSPSLTLFFFPLYCRLNVHKMGPRFATNYPLKPPTSMRSGLHTLRLIIRCTIARFRRCFLSLCAAFPTSKKMVLLSYTQTHTLTKGPMVRAVFVPSWFELRVRTVRSMINDCGMRAVCRTVACLDALAGANARTNERVE